MPCETELQICNRAEGAIQEAIAHIAFQIQRHGHHLLTDNHMQVGSTCLQIYRQTDRQTDRHAGRQTDRQTG